MFRVVVQDSRRTPTSGKIVALLGSYDPHAKQVAIDKTKAAFYLEHGAQPSGRAARLLGDEGIKLPDWANSKPQRKGKIRNPEKLRRNQPKEDTQVAAASAEQATDGSDEQTSDSVSE